MPVSQTILINNVVYVIIEDSVKEDMNICSALLKSVVEIDCNKYQYEVQLLDKCSKHPSGAKITSSQRNIFRTHDECNAVLHDRINTFILLQETTHYKDLLEEVYFRMREWIPPE